MSIKVLSILFASALFFAASLAGGLVGQSDPGADVNTGGIAVINMDKVLNEYAGYRSAKEEVLVVFKESQQKVADFAKEMDKMANELMIYSPNSREYLGLRNKIDLKKLEFKQLKQQLIMQNDDLDSQALIDAYGVITKAIGDYSSRKGLKCILSNNLNKDQFKNARYNEITNMIYLTTVVWSDDQLDISDAIITIINGS